MREIATDPLFRLRSLDECSCSCHRGLGTAMHIVACCTGISNRRIVVEEISPSPLLEQLDRGQQTMSTFVKIGPNGELMTQGTTSKGMHRPPDQDIIDRHSTPGLRRCELTRSAKREHLRDGYKFMGPDEREALLDKLYPSSPSA